MWSLEKSGNDMKPMREGGQIALTLYELLQNYIREAGDKSTSKQTISASRKSSILVNK